MSIILFATIVFLAGMIAGFGVMLIIKGLAARPSKWDRNLARARKRARRNKAMPRQRGVTRI
tara:strand:+ start:99 stop:284 length:186 start_codon:yes stop_codon:yes gene_type:complete